MTGRARRSRQRGSSVLYVVVLSPVLLLSLALATEVGGLQMQKERLRSALDQSTVVASAAAARAGSAAGIDKARAVAVMREVLAENLSPLSSAFADASAFSIARDADVAVVTDVPAPDPFDSTAVVRHPSIEVRVHVPLHTGLFGVAGLPSVETLTLTSSAALRETGA
jgi:Flp pilus assembly protein TadG